ncbi:MAG: hypothetical protein FJX62_17905 [Alphaproteobacteria bacterium]|nr:hypothetical protein [Alphaproteobacteria bacterium]
MAGRPQHLRLAYFQRTRRYFSDILTSALVAQQGNAGQQIAPGTDYGLTVVAGASPGAYRFAMFILSLESQRLLAKYGFAATTLTHHET